MQIKYDHFKKKVNFKNIIKDIFLVYIFAIIFVLIFNSMFMQAFKIHSNSMEPQIKDNTWILVNKFIYGPKYPFTEKRIFDFTKNIQRGDIIVFMSNEYIKTNKFYRAFSIFIYTISFTLIELPNLLDHKEESVYIKRIIGIPGDSIKYKLIDGKIQLYINNIKEDKIINDKYKTIEDDDKFPILNEYNVKEGEYYVLGDNRINSCDSRIWGCIKSVQIIGKAVLIYHPKIGVIK